MQVCFVLDSRLRNFEKYYNILCMSITILDFRIVFSVCVYVYAIRGNSRAKLSRWESTN